jgi:hypothetical protein
VSEEPFIHLAGVRLRQGCDGVKREQRLRFLFRREVNQDVGHLSITVAKGQLDALMAVNYEPAALIQYDSLHPAKR